jgi:hypothetical protein
LLYLWCEITVTILSLHKSIHHSGASGIASDIERGTHHIKDTVEGVEEW